MKSPVAQSGCPRIASLASLFRSLCVTGLMATSVWLPLQAHAIDSDSDGCEDTVDAYPFDYTRCVSSTGILRTLNGDSAYDQYGYSVSDAGDVNNDGYDDVIVGAYFDDNNGTDSGSARVLSGANGAVLYTFNGDGASDFFGYSVSGAGDVNNDGYDDVIVGAYGDDNTASSSGSARVFSGANGAVLYTFNGDSAVDYFGISVSAAGDVNGDGYDDVIVGAYGDDNTSSDSGSARVLSGANGAVLYTFNGDSASDYFGYSVSGAGDVNNDGFDDVIVGAYLDDNNGSSSGSARVLSGANGAVLYTFSGDSASDYFGYSVSAAGDVNNDGYDDVIVGAYYDDNNGIDSGSARVLSGANGAVLYTFSGDSASDYFGYSVSAAGDVNNDGYDDVIVGAYQDDNNGSSSGSARVLSGANGSILYVYSGDSASDYFGYSVSGAGDVNGDGNADVIVGAYLDDNAGTSSGSVRVFSGKASLTDFDSDGIQDAVDTDDDNDGTLDVNDRDPHNPSITSDTDLDGVDALTDNCPTTANADQANADGDAQGDLCDADDDNDGVPDSTDTYPLDASRSAGDSGILANFNGDSASDYFGYSVSAAGDVNNDGYDDVIVGAFGDDNNGTYSGSARVLSGANGAVLYTFNGDSASDYFGYSVSGAGDVNNDGFDDVIVGAYGDDNTGTNSGSARVLSGANGAVLYTFNGDSVSDNFGFSVSSAGDVNNDGYDDVIVGAHQDDNNGSNSGSARVLSGANGAVLYTFNGDGSSDYFGRSVSSAGDVNNDGFDDVIVGAYYDDNNGSDSGSARVLSGANGTVLYTFNGDGVSDNFGFSVSSAGDVNNDGFDDVIVGAYLDDNNGSNSGSARVFSGRAASSNWDADAQVDTLDSDDDNDGVLDINDATPQGDRLDTDGDGTGNVFDTDFDNDGVLNAGDNCPTDANADQLDSDGDAQGNVCDSDDDNDGVVDVDDIFPLDAGESADFDNDGLGNNSDTDDDADGIADTGDNCLFLANTDQLNIDGDALGDACDADNDNDGVPDNVDNCLLFTSSNQQDSDGDGIGNVCDPTPYPASGAVNGDFNPGAGANGTLWTLGEQADGKVVIGGEFTTFDGVSRNRIARLNVDGSLDTGFNPGTGVNGAYVNMLVVQPDGRIVIVGLIDQYNGVARNNLARLNTDGSLDTTFAATAVNGPVYAVTLQADGKVLIGGDFTSVGGESYTRLARLNVDGTVDTTFINPDIQPAWVATIAVQADGKILVGGIFPGVGASTSNSLVRLNADGSLDTTFNAGGVGFNQAVYQVLVQADGKILAAGGFSLYNGVAANLIARLNADGSLDTGFNSGTGGSGLFIYSMAARNGKIVIGGGFSSYDGVTRHNVARLNDDGSLDTTFNQGDGANEMVYASAIRADGDLLVGGAFTEYNGIARNRVALIVAYGDIDGDGLDNGVDTDDDNDGITDVADNCHLVANADQLNADGDLNGDACDADDDNDGLLDAADNCPQMANIAQDDFDADGQGDVCDSDDDNDTIADATDNCPQLANTDQVNLDGDALGDACDQDRDGDGVNNNVDNCPSLANTDQMDADGDGVGNVCDSSQYGDVDFDGVGDLTDNCPAIANASQLDTDNDRWGDVCDADQGGVATVMIPGQKIYASGGEVVVSVLQSDAGFVSELWLSSPAPERFIALNRNTGTTVNLGVYPAGQELIFKIYVRDTNKTFYTGPASRNADNKLHAAANLPAIGPATVGFEDIDGGGDQDFNDNMFRFLGLTSFVDTDGDTVGDYYDTDDDNDGVLDVDDAFPLDATESVDTDADGIGNNADTDDDGDNVEDGVDVFPLDGTEWTDADGDGQGDNADISDDADSIDDSVDNCLDVANDDQLDNDGDAAGDACDSDDDNDTVEDGSDNCPFVANANQSDSDSDGTGNACDATPYPDAGSVDTTFVTGAGFNGTVWATEVQADGKAVIGGEFASFNGVSRNRIARLNVDGSLDTSFNPGTGVNGAYVNMLAIQPDGRIVIVGIIDQYNGVATSNIARLNSNGSLDTGFNLTGGINGPIYAVALQADGKVLIGGDFTSVGGYSYGRLARLNANGSVDTSFTNPALDGAWVATIAVQTDGKLLVGGYFNMPSVAGGTGLLRLLPDGTLDSSFYLGAGVNNAIYHLLLQPDGRILVGGAFTEIDGVAMNRIARLDTNGTLDSTFAVGSGANGAYVYSVAVAHSKIIISGSFNSYNGVAVGNIARLNMDGTLDSGFLSGTGANDAIYASRLESSGDIIIGGQFTAYNGTTTNRVARLHGVLDSDNDGLIDPVDPDDDNDGVDDDVDNCQAVANSDQLNTDRDVQGNACDNDDDNDGYADEDDAFQLDALEWADFDGDGVGDNSDTDSDGDGLSDVDEVTAGTDRFDTDSDDDGLSDGDEVHVHLSNPLSVDSDGDDMPDGYEVSNGLDPVDGDDDLLDADGDGWTNKQEFDRNTDPANAASKPSAISSPTGSGKFYVTNGSSALNELNRTSGAVAAVGTTAVGSDVEAMAFNLAGELFALDESAGLRKVNVTTGVSTLVGSLTPSVTNGAELAIDENNVLWWINGTGLYKINPLNAAVTTVNASLAMKMIAAHQGVLYGVSGNMFYSIDKTTGVATFIGSMGVSCGAEDSMSSDGVDIWMLCESPASLYKVNKTSGQTTFVVNTAAWESLAIDGNASSADVDGDGMPDYWEIQYGLNKDLAADAIGDLDSDGLINLQEYIHGTDPTVADTDGDGWNDGREVNVERSDPTAADPVDSDNDGVLDINDRFPNDASEWGDNDNDGTGDNADTDDDNDTVLDGSDNCPSTANLDQLNTDGDSQGNACDTDDDNDGVLDVNDQLPLLAGVSVDTDADGVANSWNGNCDLACQLATGLTLDNCPSVANADQLNTDSDAQGNVCDTDDDNDGVPDTSDAFPLDGSEWGDMDQDGIGNNADPDDDNDGLSDILEQSLGTAANNADTDGDGVSDYAEVMTHASNPLSVDSDSDAMTDGWEVTYGLNPVSAADASLDLDVDGLNNLAEFIAGTNPTVTDSDGDTFLDGIDNCPAISNVSQADYDSNGKGDVCDDKSTQLALGSSHTCAITPAGGVKCWGSNSTGQLGDNTSSSHYYPVQVSGLTSGVNAVAAGSSHTCALLSTGAVKCWGSNSSGQLGDGSSTSRFVPVQVTGLETGVQAITAGNTHTCAIKSDKTVVCWGYNGYGQLGNNTGTNSLVPTAVSGLVNATALAAGYSHSCAVAAGVVKCWGQNSYGQIGDGTTVQRLVPTLVSGMVSTVKSLSVGDYHSCAVTTDGAMKCWGNNGNGQLGTGVASNSLTPVQVTGMNSGVLGTDGGVYHTCAVSSAGAVSCWGYNSYGQLGNGTTSSSYTPVAVSGLGTGMVAVATAYYQSCALGMDGTVRCWGYNGAGQLGDNSTSQRLTPVTVPFVLSQTITVIQAAPATAAMGSSFVVTATASSGLSVSFTASGACTISGNTVTVSSSVTGICELSYNQAGNGDVYPATTVTSSTSVYDPDLDKDGVLNEQDAFPNDAAEWQDTDADGIGNNADTDDDNDTVADATDNCPQMSNSAQTDADGNGVGDVCDWKAGGIAAGNSHACAISQSGGVNCWGSNSYYQLGDGTTTMRTTPVPVSGLASGVKAVASEGDTTCALTTAGAVKCWGRNTNGQLGDGTTANRTTPVQVSGLASGVSAIAVTYNSSCALKTNGQVVCWGYNYYGQIGDGTTTSRLTPVTVTGLTAVTAVVGGENHVCALASGVAKCWGYNGYGQLGDATTTNRYTPTLVSGLSGASSIGVGRYHSCAITTSAELKCWGYNYYGHLGDGTTTSRTTPVLVSGMAGAGGLSMVSGGSYHTCAVMSNGAAKCWGYNAYGEVGDDTTAPRATPVQVSGLTSGVTAVSGGNHFSCALMNTGNAKCWGYNGSGQLGINSTSASYVPANVGGYKPAQTITVTQAAPASAAHGSSFVVAATASSGLAVAVTTSGGCSNSGNSVTMNSGTTACNVFFNQSGSSSHQPAAQIASVTYAALASQTITINTPAPATVALGSSFTVNASASSGSAVVVAASGGCSNSGNVVTATVLATCTINYSQAGNVNYAAATPVVSTTTVFNPDLDGDGVNNEFDAFPNDPSESLDTDGDGVGNNADTDDDNDGVADTQDNCAYVANANQLDANGNGRGDVCDVQAGRVAAGTSHTCSITEQGAVWCWGYNASGQLGNGTLTSSTVPVQVSGFATGAISLAAGDSHTCVLTSTGGVKCWGYNLSGNLGDGSLTSRNTPVQVSGLTSGVVSIAASYTSTCALLDIGVVRCWGSNGSGQLGNGSYSNSAVPVNVSGLSGVTSLTPGGYDHFCVVAAGAAKCWGSNIYGKLGDGTTTSRPVPTQVTGLASGVASVSTGWYHSCAVTTAGAMLCWGNNPYGQLGNGTSTQSSIPVPVTGLSSGVRTSEGGMEHTCAVTTAGAVKCWGGNSRGQVGDGSTVNRNVPFQVSGMLSGNVMVAAGMHQTCAMTSTQIRCWGANDRGQVGDGYTINRALPVSVYGWPVDTDGDGVNDNVDAFPSDPFETTDTDADGVGNNTDGDDDGDGVPDVIDAAPLDGSDQSELDLPVNGIYKGSVIRDAATVQ